MYNFDRLVNAGISLEDAQALRRISMTLHRWHELECGDGNEYASWRLVRGHKERRDGQHPGGHGPRYIFVYDEDGEPFEERHVHSRNDTQYTRVPDRELGALKRLRAIMAKYPKLTAFVQTDPRGASLYIGEGLTDTNYNRGIAVYR